MKQYLTLGAAAMLVGRSSRTIERWVSSGDVSKYVIDGRTCVETLELMSAEATIFRQKQIRLEQNKKTATRQNIRFVSNPDMS